MGILTLKLYDNRNGIPLSRQTISNWLIKCAEDYLVPIYDRLHEQLLEHEVLHADETTLQVLHEEGKTPQSKSYMWLYRTSGNAKQPIVLYDYQPDRKGERPRDFLKGFHGYLHADGYSSYHRLQHEITVVGCWAHARRKFDEALKGLPEKARADSLSRRAKRYCDKLFDLESRFSELSVDERCLKRQEQSKPLMEEFFLWLGAQHASTKSAFGSAVEVRIGPAEISGPIFHGRQAGDQQQPRGTEYQAVRDQTQELPVRQHRPWR